MLDVYEMYENRTEDLLDVIVIEDIQMDRENRHLVIMVILD